jgi:hypothetical protein
MKFSPIEWAYAVGFWLGSAFMAVWILCGFGWAVVTGLATAVIAAPIQYRLHKRARALYGRGSQS